MKEYEPYADGSTALNVNTDQGGTQRTHRRSSIARVVFLGILICSLLLSAAAMAISLTNASRHDTTLMVFNGNNNSNTTVPPQVAQPMDLASFAGKRILFIAAHPDDVVGASGAFVAGLTSSAVNADVHVLILTNGNAGCNNSISKAECAVLRQAEEKACDHELGVNPDNVVVEQQFDDNHLWDGTYRDVDVISVIVRSIRTVQPDVVFSFFPDPIWSATPAAGYDDMGFHPDHQKVGKLVASTIAGFSASSESLYNSSYGQPWRVEQLWFWQFVNPTHCYKVPAVGMAVQLIAFLMHQTQYVNSSQITDWVAEFSLLTGANCGYGRVPAEGFQRYW